MANYFCVYYNRADGTGGAGGWASQILGNKLTLIQGVGQILPTTLLLTPLGIFIPSYGPVEHSHQLEQPLLATKQCSKFWRILAETRAIGGSR